MKPIAETNPIMMNRDIVHYYDDHDPDEKWDQSEPRDSEAIQHANSSSTIKISAYEEKVVGGDLKQQSSPQDLSLVGISVH